MAGDGVSTFFKEYVKLTKDIDRLTQGQATVGPYDFNEEDQINFFQLELTPNDGYYKNATCKFQVEYTNNYPTDPPEVKCMSQMYHPNIDIIDRDDNNSSSICVNLLGSDWSPEVGLDGTVMAVLFLLHNPNLDDSLNPLIGSGTSEDEFAELVVKACNGEEVEGYVFDRLYPEDKCDEEEDSVVNTKEAEGERPEEGGEETGQVVDGDGRTGGVCGDVDGTENAGNYEHGAEKLETEEGQTGEVTEGGGITDEGTSVDPCGSEEKGGGNAVENVLGVNGHVTELSIEVDGLGQTEVTYPNDTKERQVDNVRPKDSKGNVFKTICGFMNVFSFIKSRLRRGRGKYEAPTTEKER